MHVRADFRVKELDCAEEIPPLKNGLLGKPGILGLDFDLLNSKIIVAYDNAATGPAEIMALVQAAGMHASPWAARAAAPAGGSWWQRQGRLAMTLLSGLLLVAGAAAH